MHERPYGDWLWRPVWGSEGEVQPPVVGTSSQLSRERVNPIWGLLWRQTMSGKKESPGKGVELWSRFSLICTYRHRHIFYPPLPAALVPACYQSSPSTAYTSQPRYMENKLLVTVKRWTFEDSSRLCPRHPFLLMWSSHPSYLLLSQDSSCHLHARSHRHPSNPSLLPKPLQCQPRFKPEIWALSLTLSLSIFCIFNELPSPVNSTLQISTEFCCSLFPLYCRLLPVTWTTAGAP